MDYRRGFLTDDDAWDLFHRLRDGVAWREETLTLFGRPVTVPRLLAWYGDHGLNYRYSGTDHVCSGWSPELAALRQRLETEAGLYCNLVLLNRYRSGADCMGWHADDEPGLDARVASLSLGAPRRFLLRPTPRARSESMDLEHGSLLIFPGRVRHSLPRTRRPAAERINLTFRLLGEVRRPAAVPPG